MINGLIFNGEGPMMDGTWYNPNNGESFTVADTFFQDNQYMVKTTDGRLLDYNFIQNYVKSDKPIPKIEKPQSKTNELPQEVTNLINDDGILEDDLALINGQQKPQSLGNLYKNDNPELAIIEKALSKKSKPYVYANILWGDFPKKEIEALTDIMDINIDSVIDWYINKLDIKEIKQAVKESMVWYIKMELGLTKPDISLAQSNIESQYVGKPLSTDVEISQALEAVIEEEIVEKPKTAKAKKAKKTKK